MVNRLAFLGLGAALMFLYDPESGRRRRAGLQAKVDSATQRLQQARDLIERGVPQQKLRALKDPHWSPKQRGVVGALGAACATYGYLRGGVRGVALCAVGTALTARALANERVVKALTDAHIRVEESIFVDAPIPQVFAYWRNLANLPEWMSHVREVRPLGNDRYHWVVDGPAGIAVEWDSEVLNFEEDREMTWRSVGDATVGSVGRVRFEEEGDGTVIHVQMRYSPPAGVAGHAVARLFGVDPKSEIHEDLARMKACIETGKPPANPRWRDSLPFSHARH